MVKRFKIGIVGAGFSGTALAATLQRLSPESVEIVLCDKSGRFGAGPAYSTPYTHHLLNVRAQDMSAFEDEPNDFVNWLQNHVGKQYLAQQFVPRCFYHDYLQDILSRLHSTVTFVPDEVVDVIPVDQEGVSLVFSNHNKIKVDRVVFALGNSSPASFPFPVSDTVRCIDNPWDYTALTAIDKHDPVLIVGTGLSMIDAVLTLYHQHHKGKIYAISRHGLLPLPHTDITPSYSLEQGELAISSHGLVKQLRSISQKHIDKGGDWRSVINAFRVHLPRIWRNASFKDKKRFLTHIMPYWNIHRHRVHADIMNLLSTLIAHQQLAVFSGRVISVKEGDAIIKRRHTHDIINIPVRWLINCMGPKQRVTDAHSPLLAALLKRQVATLDALQLGFSTDSAGALKDATGKVSSCLYAIGAPTKGETWEIGAVPEIRRQVFALARHLLAMT